MSRLTKLLCCSVMLWLSHSRSHAQSPSIAVSVTQVNSGGTTVYTYNVTNTSQSSKIVDVTLGLDTNLNGGELRIPPQTVTTPNGWVYSLIQTEESPYYMIDLDSSDSSMIAIGPGQLFVFTVTVRGADPLYSTAHINAIFDSGDSAASTLGTSTRPAADVNGNGTVDCLDVLIVKQALGQVCSASAPNGPLADVNRDCVVDVRDLAIISQMLPAGMRCQ